MDWYGLLLPVAYLTVLVGSLATFSHLYRARKAAKSASLEPWFPPHVPRNIYLSLLHLDPLDADSVPAGTEKKLSRVPDSIIKAALLRRAVEDISRILQIRSQKTALQALLQQGSVGEELWERFQRAESEIDEEVKDVVNEANALSPNWGQHIFASADQIYHQQFIKESLAEMPTQVEVEKQWWTKRKAGIKSSFMKELEADDSSSANALGGAGTTDAAAAKSSSTGKQSAGENKKPTTPKIGSEKKSATSDDEAVLVESGGPTGAQGPVSSGTSTPASGGGGGTSKKKKKGGKK